MGKYTCHYLSTLPLLPVGWRFEDNVLIKNSLKFINVIRFNDSKKTLTDKIIDKIMTRFADAYKLELGAIIRDK